MTSALFFESQKDNGVTCGSVPVRILGNTSLTACRGDTSSPFQDTKLLCFGYLSLFSVVAVTAFNSGISSAPIGTLQFRRFFQPLLSIFTELPTACEGSTIVVALSPGWGPSPCVLDRPYQYFTLISSPPDCSSFSTINNELHTLFSFYSCRYLRTTHLRSVFLADLLCSVLFNICFMCLQCFSCARKTEVSKCNSLRSSQARTIFDIFKLLRIIWKIRFTIIFENTSRSIWSHFPLLTALIDPLCLSGFSEGYLRSVLSSYFSLCSF